MESKMTICALIMMFATTGKTHRITSPNFDVGGEYGKSANCKWELNTPEANGKDYALILTVKQLKLYAVKHGRKHCLGSYNLTINRDRIKCDRYVHGATSGKIPIPANYFCNAYYNSPICANASQIQECDIQQQTLYPVSVSYFSDGRKDPDASPTPMYFTITFKFIECSTGKAKPITSPLQFTEYCHNEQTTTIPKPTTTEIVIAPATTNKPATTNVATEVITTKITDFSSINTHQTSHRAAATSGGTKDVKKIDTSSIEGNAGGPKEQDNSNIIAAVAGAVGGGGAVLAIVLIVVACKKRENAKATKPPGFPLNDRTTTGRAETGKSGAAMYENIGQTSVTIKTNQSRATGTNDSLPGTSGSTQPLYEVVSEAQLAPQSSQLPGDDGYAQITGPSAAAGNNQSESWLYSVIL